MVFAVRGLLASILLFVQPDGDRDLCRVTISAPRVRIDVALPTAVPLAALLPTLLLHSGEDAPEQGLAHGGWALQRAGESPLNSTATVAALGIRDGDTLYLRPRQDAMPAPVYDDTVDAITDTLRAKARRWQPEHAHAAALAALGIVLLTGAATLAGLTTPRLAVSGVAAVAAALALLGAVATARAFGSSATGTVLGAGALPFAFLAGLDGAGPGAGLHGVTPPQFLVGATAFLVAAAIAAAAVGDRGSLLTGTLAAGIVAVACSLLALFTSGAGAAAAAISVVLALTPAIAPVAYRMAGLPRPSVPASSEELRARREPIDSADIARRAIAADRVVVALLAATGVVVVTGMIIMLTARGWGGTALAGLASCVLLLRGRLFTGTAQRGWLLGTGLAGVAVFGAVAVPRLGALGAIAVVCGLGVVCTVLASAAISPGRRVSPGLRRTTDLLELCAIIATIPLALQVLHVFNMARSLGG
jgi:type VII secretion integral membrane protein EccD